MMKNLYLLICLTIFSFALQAQKKTLINDLDEEKVAIKPGTGDLEFIYKDKNKYENKALGDTLYYEDFDAGLNGWVVTNLNNNTFNWVWDTVYDAGSTRPNTPKIASTTASNGFLSLPADFYNSPTTIEVMNTFITSPAIAISPKKSLLISYQQYHARCCYFASYYQLEVSADSVNWDTINVDEGTPFTFANAPSNNPVSNVTFNISELTADEDTIYLRFRAYNNWLYHWMIDDIAIVEGPKSDIEIAGTDLLFNPGRYQISPLYNQIPYDLFPPLTFSGVMINNGWDSAYNANMVVDVTHLEDLNGNVKNSLLYSQTENVTGTNLPPFPAFDSLIENDLTFSPLVNGTFRVDFRVESDSVDQIQGNETDEKYFVTTDSVYARDDGDFNVGRGIGPTRIFTGLSSGGNNSDACGTTYIIESRTQGNKVYPTSITYYVTNDTANIGIGISPSIWVFNEDTAFVRDAWLPEDYNNTSGKGLVLYGNVYTVKASDTNSFLTLPLDTGISTFDGLDSGVYVVGWEVLFGSKADNSVYFEVADDISMSLVQPAASSFLFHANGTPKVIISTSETIKFQPVIRLNIATLPIQTTVEDLTNSKHQIFDVIPNPSSGEVKINIMVEKQATYSLNVWNTLGQSVYHDVITVNGGMTERLDLSSLDQGLYILTMENAVEKLEKKIILK